MCYNNGWQFASLHFAAMNRQQVQIDNVVTNLQLADIAEVILYRTNWDIKFFSIWAFLSDWNVFVSLSTTPTLP